MASNHDLVDTESSASGNAPVEPSKADEDSRQIHSVIDEKAIEIGGSQDDPPAAPRSEQALQTVETSEEEYSVLTVGQKKLIVMAGSIASVFSPMATSIYCKSRSLPHIYIRPID